MEEMIFKEQSLGEANRQMISHHKEFRHLSCLCEMESHKTFMVLPKGSPELPGDTAGASVLTAGLTAVVIVGGP